MALNPLLNALAYAITTRTSILDAVHNANTAVMMRDTSVVVALPIAAGAIEMSGALVVAFVLRPTLVGPVLCHGVAEFVVAFKLAVIRVAVLETLLDAMLATVALIALRIGAVVFAVLPSMHDAAIGAIFGIGAADKLVRVGVGARGGGGGVGKLQ